MILLQIALQSLRQLQLIYVIVRQSTHDIRPAQVLQWEREIPVQRTREHRLEEHAAARVFVVLDQTTDGLRSVHIRVVGVEAELVIPLLDACVQRATVFAEGHAEEEFLLGRVAEEERAFRFAV